MSGVGDLGVRKRTINVRYLYENVDFMSSISFLMSSPVLDLSIFQLRRSRIVYPVSLDTTPHGKLLYSSPRTVSPLEVDDFSQLALRVSSR